MTAEQTATEQSTDKRNLRKVRQGIVTSNKMEKTITVTVEYKEKHPQYSKFVQRTKKVTEQGQGPCINHIVAARLPASTR